MSSYHPSPYKIYIYIYFMMRTCKIYFFGNFQVCAIILLIIVTIFYITYPWLTYFITGSLYVLNPFTHYTYPLNLLLFGDHHSVLCVYEFYLLVCFGL